MKIKTAASLAAGLAAVFFTVQAHATSCSTSDVTMTNSQDGKTYIADGCEVYTEDGMEALLGQAYKFDIKKAPNPGNSPSILIDNDLLLTLIVPKEDDKDHLSGDWTLKWTNTADAKLDLMVVLKSDKGYGVFSFEDLLFDAPGGAYNNTWTVSFNLDNNPQLAYLALVLPKGTKVNEVPEPATMLLFGTGLLGLAGISRRKK